MTYKTFFTVFASSGPPKVDARATYLDINERLVVEKVAARLEGKEIGFLEMAIAFPEALAAARARREMVRKVEQQTKTRTYHGPFFIETEHVPTDDGLLAWWEENRA